MIMRLLMLLFLGCVSSLALAGDTYRWEDEQGRVHYSDQPPPAGARNVRRAREFDDEAEQALPYRLQVIVDKSPVTLYVTDCGEPCNKARELLITRGVPHTLLDPSKPEVQEALMALTKGQLEVPVVEVGKNVLRGFEENQWNAALDAAGYPSYAMIEVKPYVPQPAEKSDGQGGEDGDVAANDTAEIESDESLVEDAESADVEQDE